MTDDQLRRWCLAVRDGDRARGVAPAGSFLQAVAEAALRADLSNFAILRPALVQVAEKYPEYSGSGS